MDPRTREEYEARIAELESQLADSEHLVEAIKSGEVDAFAVTRNNQSEVYTLQSGDYAYRLLVENFREGALNITEEGLVVYTNNYFLDLLGLSYEKVVGKSVLDLIHPDSLEHFNALFTKALAGQSKGEIQLEVNDKIIPIYLSLTSLYPRVHTVGMIVTDLTDKKKDEEVILKYQHDLESKNIELLQSNMELASFSYMASHDLQEPLRKIQTFSKRILEHDLGQVNPTFRDYFQRIINASSRMQNLIEALLDYSRTNTADLNFTKTNLNDIVIEVTTNLNDMINESKARIEYEGLPTMMAIPIQMNQLFSNLILNSIKYGKPNVPPLIRIKAARIPPYLNSNGKMGIACYEITLEDNGIGFEQQYAEKIFEIFQRLHGKLEYEGTGIGLAICKKIIQNHNGTISARGIPGVGTVMTLTLPEKQPRYDLQPVQ